MKDIFRKRVAIREFRSKSIKNEKLKKILLAASYAPSGKNRHPVFFIVVKDRQTKEKLAITHRRGCSFIRNANIVIVVCADPTKSGIWLEDASIAASYMWLKCSQLGLAACWAHVKHGLRGYHNFYAQSYVRRLLKIPRHIRVVCFLAVGYPLKKYYSHQPKEYLTDKIYYKSWGRRFK